MVLLNTFIISIYPIIAVAVPYCPVTKAVIPAAPDPLPVPSEGLVVRHVAIGSGTQNYTCESPASVPTPIGAVATLYNASCIASTDQRLLAKMTADAQNAPINLAVSGSHFFPELKLALFDLHTAASDIGIVPCHKTHSVNAPAQGAVPWLKLGATSDVTGDIKEIYRVDTHGGAAPEDCSNSLPTFEVHYVAQYWFFAGHLSP